jgi:molybdate transport system substrate-binding protein
MRHLLSCGLAALPLLCSAEQLTVSAAASLADAFREIGVRFEAARPGVTLRFNVAASGVLVQQIVQGAPVDVFASADAESIERGVQQQVLDAATRRDFARNALVLIVPAQDAPAVTALEDLRRPEVRRIALGQPATVPVGRYAKQALDAAGLWAAVQPRLVFGQNARQVLDYVARGEADAGFVYRTDAASAKDKVRVMLAVGGHAPVTYPAAVVRDSRHAALARAFVAFLTMPEAQAILARHGFDKP